ncbi:MAG: sigma-54 dependent transcriptional regulator [Proteobacteria bacterium]|nr:sigma-54 dependent transcriptional regulator [Pseudomonadota bacterium]
MHKILIVDDDQTHRQMIDTILRKDGYDIYQADDGDQAIDNVQKQFFDIILMDIRMKRMDGISALKAIKKLSPSIPVIIMTAFSSVNTAVDALKSGAYDYLTKPVDSDELSILIKKVLHLNQLEKENVYLKERLGKTFHFKNIIGNSAAIQPLFEAMTLSSPTDATILISGESGTGKELIANAIHENSPRKDMPLIKLNCAALPESLLESELFGHLKGAFTGAATNKKGRFHLAHKGTIFLDEIADMPLSTQSKILRVIQEQEFEPLGGTQTIKVDVRIIAATNRNLKEAVQTGRFREDLYFRLNVIHLKVPPLKERSEDIPLLTEFFLKKFTQKNKRFIKGLTPKGMDILMRYDWPGNIRELQNVIERSVIMSRGDLIEPDVFPEPLKKLYQSSNENRMALNVGKSLKDMEKEMILLTLKKTNGNRTHTADILGISRRTLQLKLKEYGVH